MECEINARKVYWMILDSFDFERAPEETEKSSEAKNSDDSKSQNEKPSTDSVSVTIRYCRGMYAQSNLLLRQQPKLSCLQEICWCL